jgi:hypothetical protein
MPPEPSLATENYPNQHTSKKNLATSCILVFLFILSGIFFTYEYHKKADVRDCLGLTSEYSIDSCIISKARIEHNQKLCDYLVSPTSWATCASAVIASNKNLSACASFEESNEKDECYQYYAGTNGEISACELVIDKNIKAGCFINAAVTLNDALVCQKIPDENWKAECLGHFAGQFDVLSHETRLIDVASCKTELMDKQAISSCITKIARTSMDIKICDLQDAPIDKQMCYINVGVIDGGDVTICQTLIDDVNKDGCYVAFATSHNSETTCDLIMDTDYLNSCKSFFTKKK